MFINTRNELVSLVASLSWLLVLSNVVQAEEYLNGIKWEYPPVVTPGTTNADPPSGAVVLFDGTDLSKWANGENWTVEDGAAITGRGVITSKEHFGDCQVHIESEKFAEHC